MQSSTAAVIAGVGVAVSCVGLVSGLAGAYVSLQARALLAEVRRETAELENRIVAPINGTYVRTPECIARKEATSARLDALVSEIKHASG
jgi:hypothetical protein